MTRCLVGQENYPIKQPDAVLSNDQMIYQGYLRLTQTELPPVITGRPFVITLSLHNESSVCWPANGEEPVRLAYHWLRTDGSLWIHDGCRTNLPHDLGPGESIVLEATIDPPAEPGTALLQLTAVQENKSWFEPHGFGKVDLDISILDFSEYVRGGVEPLQNLPDPRAGETLSVAVRLRNESTHNWSTGGIYPLRICYHWHSAEGCLLERDGLRTNLPADLKGGDSRIIIAKVKMPQKPGNYVLEWSVVQERVVWFEESPAFQSVRSTVTVTEAASPENHTEHTERAKVLATYAQETEHWQYTDWIERYDTLSTADIEKMRTIMANWPRHPLISVIMPTYNTPSAFLRAAIESVQQQIYPYWELCIADDASTEPKVREILQEYAVRDPRIKLCFRPINGHISAASNSALELASGEYVALLDHDDTFAPHTLYFIAGEVVTHPETAWLYFDWDYITEKGRRFNPNFNFGPNFDLCLAVAFMTTHAVYRTDKVREAKGFRVGYEGSQDHDLGLRMLDLVEWQQIRHIPHILYHWRSHAGSVAGGGIAAKPYAAQAGVRAVQDYLERHGIQGKVTKNHNLPGYRVRYALPDNPPLASIIIPTRNRLDLLKPCIASILEKTIYPNYEILIIDNDSDDPKALTYLDYIHQEKLARVLHFPGKFNYSAMNNYAVEQAQGEVICLLNNDTEVISESWLSEMVSHALRPEIGVVGARLWYENNTLQHAGVYINNNRQFTHIGIGNSRRLLIDYKNSSVNLSAVTGACMVMRKHVFQHVGGLNARWLPIGLNDVDLCFKIRQAGWRVLYTPYAELFHYESLTRGKAEKTVVQQWTGYMNSRWPEAFQPDAFFRDTSDFVTIKKSIKKYSTNTKLFFLHIPKTAGISFRNIVSTEYPRSDLFVFPAKLMMQCYELDQNALAKAKTAMGNASATFSHFRFGIHDAIKIKNTSYITLLRKPSSRIISHYNYLMKKSWISPIENTLLAELPLADLLRKDIIPGNLMTRMIAGGKPELASWNEIENGPHAYGANFCGFGLPPEVWRGEYEAILNRPDTHPDNDQAVLEAALKNIREQFLFVGLTEKMAEAVAVLGQHLEWDNYSTLPELNVNKDKKVREIDAETHRVIEEYNQLDIQLYDYIRNMPNGYFLNPHIQSTKNSELSRSESQPKTTPRMITKRRCIIHFGMHKTGSTSIQQALLQNADNLGKFHYLHAGQANSSVPIAIAFSDNPEKHHFNRLQRLNEEQLKQRAEEVKSRLACQLQMSPKADFLLSGEYISQISHVGLIRLVDWLGHWVDEIVAVGYVRPPASFMASAFQQRLKDGDRMPDWHVVRPYQKHFQIFDQVLGKERVHFWKFDPASFTQGCVVRDFCARLDIPIMSGIVRRNESLSRDAVALLYAYRKYFPEQGKNGKGRAALLALLNKVPGPKFQLSAERIKAALSEQKEDIAWMETRMGISLTELIFDGPGTVHNEEDLLKFSPQSIEWLDQQLAAHHVPAKITAATPEKVAEWIYKLYITLV